MIYKWQIYTIPNKLLQELCHFLKKNQVFLIYIGASTRIKTGRPLNSGRPDGVNDHLLIYREDDAFTVLT